MERWQPIEGFDGYEVSDHGRVRSRRQRSAGRILKGGPCGGYRRVGLVRNGERVFVLVHRLVALAFLDTPADFANLDINHKNGIKGCNRKGNLEWATRAQNVQHAFDVLGRVVARGAESKRSKAVIATSIATGECVRFGAMMDAARSGFNVTNISAVCRGERKSHAGRYWSFAGM